jgi:hypothetical protein
MDVVQQLGEAVEDMTSTLQPSTASGAQTSTIVIDFKVVLNGAFGTPFVERPIDFDRALAAYPAAPEQIQEPSWNVGGTPLGI